MVEVPPGIGVRWESCLRGERATCRAELGLLISTALSPVAGKQEGHKDQAQEWGSYSLRGFITEGEAWPWGVALGSLRG